MPGSAVEALAQKLKEAHAAAPEGRKVASIYMFGLANASALRGVSKHDVAERAGLSRSYGTDLATAVVLSEYVTITKPLA
ncbi:HTH-like domain-containing protein [Sphingomonas hengshuiensis]|uniref:HTH-like domain-containing protein n=1 Tax=Sphingomonas hengshuiensis TaxID=1609977 RepID=A0A7U4LGY6_9SPHN|nr:hypothetical protein TS85_20260 [Sphingomonas hengshuiensis]